jgi:hypothetical protein
MPAPAVPDLWRPRGEVRLAPAQRLDRELAQALTRSAPAPVPERHRAPFAG